MFGKKKNSPSLTWIAQDCRLNGELSLESDCMIAGHISGKVEAKGNIIIEPEGYVEGELEANEVSISGHFKGKLKCQKLSITANGYVDGEVLSEKIEIFEGGQFVGSRIKEAVPLLEKPKAKTQEADKQPELIAVSN